MDLTWLTLMKVRGFAPAAIVDAGASVGNWTCEVQKIYPDAHYLLIEPRAECQPKLHDLKGNITVAPVLIGNKADVVEFNIHDDQSSIFRNTKGQRYGVEFMAEMTTLDALVKKTGFPQPDLLKLDLQGAELLALEGAGQVLQHCSCIVMETSLIEIYNGIPLIRDAINFMYERGFVLYDMTEMLRRSLDQALAQVDCIFVPEQSTLRADRRWGWGDFS
jgi:FkbM family methyltransferase